MLEGMLLSLECEEEERLLSEHERKEKLRINLEPQEARKNEEFVGIGPWSY